MPRYNRGATFSVFAERRLADYLAERENRLKAKIDGESENYILNVNETTYVNHLAEQLNITPLVIDFDNSFVTEYEAQIPSERLNSTMWNVRPGKLT